MRSQELALTFPGAGTSTAHLYEDPPSNPFFESPLIISWSLGTFLLCCKQNHPKCYAVCL